ncbi:amino acid adenylation domain-containing protein [Streptomyces sp. WMMB 322]|uniref:amino acid adenylation domain-containing protein n=1 Tax=Streptomyces sp. WMMB 322 TaxID=1286821 RepID=UPI0006E177F5|nr:amino acid adenylation domain-containing protein [Streptomyces sp. WMMB 322]SCK54692.1 amino acid adenylation domain-containing protein [Streptomyces sp. WMMB 322]
MGGSPFEYDGAGYAVLRNDRGQRSLWPEGQPVPAGWHVERGPVARAEACAFVERVWPDVCAVAGPPPELPTLPEQFARVAADHPREIAVEARGEVLSYEELEARVHRLARVLLARGLTAGSMVGLSLARGAWQPVAALAVAAAGAAYVPLDPTYPRAWIEHAVSDAGLDCLLRSGPHDAPTDTVPVLDLDDPGVRSKISAEASHPVAPEERVRPLTADDPMYVIYTSGSTGVPKGVVVPHAGIADLVAAQRRWIGAGPGDRVLQWASFNFDAGFWDMTLALLSGATLVLTDERDVLPGDDLHRTLRHRRISHAVLPPVALSLTDSTGVLDGGVLLSTGDVCTPALVRTWAPNRRMYNGYGPTEMTVGVTMAGPVDPDAPISIGRPWPGNEVRVLDDDLLPCAPGEEGELYLVGSGEALGYLNRPGLTAERFVADPFGAPGARMYRSGDRGHRAADGELFFSGRADQQVKVHGYRIELGEIEAALDSCPGVALSAVVVSGSLDSARMTAYVAAHRGSSPEEAGLRRRLARRLPAHMVPTEIVLVESLPTTSNGKVDRRALARLGVSRGPVPEGARAAASDEPAGTPSPVDEDERLVALCELAARVLQVPAIGAHENFFDRGGHSVLAVKLSRSVRDEWGLALPVRAIIESPTMADLGKHLQAS